MNERERLLKLIEILVTEAEQGRWSSLLPLPEQWRAAPTEDLAGLWRGLVNERPPLPPTPGYIELERAYLTELLARRGQVDYQSLPVVERVGASRLYLWQGDITRLAIDGIMNAANSALLGCFVPGHLCIDNAIHTFAGIPLRLECQRQMQAQGHPEPTAEAKITPGYSLPAKYVLHTVGPIVGARLTATDEALLVQAYRKCLALAVAKGLHSLACCCLSTGVFRFPPERAAELAVATVRDFLTTSAEPLDVLFNVFKDADLAIYTWLLGPQN